MDSQTRVLVIAAPGRLRDSLCAMLQAEGQAAAVGKADDGGAGLQKLADSAPMLVLLDADLLDDEAWRTLAEIKRRWPKVHCLVWAHTFSQTRRAQSAGADDVLGAQFSADSLLAAMAKAAGQDGRRTAGPGGLPQ